MELLFTQFLPKNPRFQPHLEYPIPRCTDQISVNATTKQYAAKLLNSIPNYGTSGKDKDKFSKFPTKHQDKTPKYVFNKQNFPTLKPPPKLQGTLENNPQQPATSNLPSQAPLPSAGKLLSQPKKPFDLKGLQEQIRKNLELDFTKLLNTKIDALQSDVCHTCEKWTTIMTNLAQWSGLSRSNSSASIVC